MDETTAKVIYYHQLCMDVSDKILLLNNSANARLSFSCLNPDEACISFQDRAPLIAIALRTRLFQILQYLGVMGKQ